jgi:hypothetical protein
MRQSIREQHLFGWLEQDRRKARILAGASNSGA